SRLGLQPEALEEFLTAARRHTSLTLTGVMTHYANADDLDEATNRKQATLFAESLDSVKAAGFTPDWIHTSNSAATQSFDDGLSTMIRPGLTLFGISPIRRLEAFRPAMRWVTSPVHIKTIAAGTPVSYGGHWVASRPSRIATLPVGYADGYPRTLSNRAEVLVRGQRAPVIGSVCMDMVMIDVTHIDEVKLTDEVVLLGTQGELEIDAHELAQHAGAIAYEMVTGVQNRVPREYTGFAAKNPTV
ncbi:MAG: alanine racemase, partial [Myxococcota bacterium]